MSQVSTVPKSSSPASARSRAPGTFRRIHAILLAEKYASAIRPVFALMLLPTSGVPQTSSMMGAVRRHCHTMAL